MVKVPSIKKMGSSYLLMKKKLLKSYRFINYIKLWFAVFVFLLALWTYGYFVNISSTKWYFIKQEREKLSEVKFQNEIVKIDIKKIEWELSSKMLIKTIWKKESLTWDTIVIKDFSQLTYK